MTPLYFFPGMESEQVTRDYLLQQGPSAALRDCLASDQSAKQILKANCKVGPTGSSGTLVAAQPGEAPPEIMYSENRQRWVDFGDYWIGVFEDSRPTPEELARPDQVNGFLEELADGHLWNCPVVRTPCEVPRMRVPRKFGVDDQGKLVAAPVDECRAAWETSAKIWDALCTGREFDLDEGIGWAAEMLSLNYRVSLQECLLLDLINDHNLERIFFAACDRDFIDLCLKELKKKN